MIYRVMRGRLAANPTDCSGRPVTATGGDVEEAFDSVYPARLLLLELVELSPVLLVETALDWYVGTPEDDGRCWAIWLDKSATSGE